MKNKNTFTGQCIYCRVKTHNITGMCVKCSEHIEYFNENRKELTQDDTILKHQISVDNVFIFESELSIKDFNLHKN